ncbi:hypothetical protein [Domibacillus indicus]|uniref:hypothetical protein n=1 Tax=Domibacillus indicus TaxID=1437523 RepID=UPI00061816F3|nr:hypothetical protein [Domibacillus indicus]
MKSNGSEKSKLKNSIVGCGLAASLFCRANAEPATDSCCLFQLVRSSCGSLRRHPSAHSVSGKNGYK